MSKLLTVSVLFVLGLAASGGVSATAQAGDPFCLTPPVPGPVVAEYAPTDAYEGHWGVDLAAKEGSPVISAVGGEVTFSGDVAGTRAVTVRDGNGYRVTVSSLGDLDVTSGQQVDRGDQLGTSSHHGGNAAVHVSLRDEDGYRDPEPLLGCATPGRVRLIPIPEAIS